MIHHEYTIHCSEEYLISRGISSKRSLFFDIETTGFKASHSHLYLIGAAFRSPDAPESFQTSGETTAKWTIRQWLAERPQEEPLLLRSFAEFLSSFDTILHFNGKRFDIPYLEEKYTQYGLNSPFSTLSSVDLYQDFRPLKSFLKLERMNQKSLEEFLDLNREDIYDGGRLIPIYRQFCKTGCDEHLQLLLLHNREDVSGMFALTSLYGYLNFFSQINDPDPFPECSVKYLENQDGSRQALITFSLRTCVPVPISHSREFAYLTLQKKTGKLLIPMRKDTLCYFFEDYKNYYYLPQEDQAIHKSVAAYVDKAYRQAAKKENCYIHQQGWFLPQPLPFVSPAFRPDYHASLHWLLWKEEEWADPDQWKSYVSMLIRALLTV